MRFNYILAQTAYDRLGKKFKPKQQSRQLLAEKIRLK